MGREEYRVDSAVAISSDRHNEMRLGLRDEASDKLSSCAEPLINNHRDLHTVTNIPATNGKVGHRSPPHPPKTTINAIAKMSMAFAHVRQRKVNDQKEMTSSSK